MHAEKQRKEKKEFEQAKMDLVSGLMHLSLKGLFLGKWCVFNLRVLEVHGTSLGVLVRCLRAVAIGGSWSSVQ